MILYDSKQWLDDIDKVLNKLSELENLENNSILITGSTGLIGSSIVDLLLRYNDTHSHKINIYAAGRRKDKYHSRFGYLTEREDLSFVFYDALQEKVNIKNHIDYIIHTASNAYPEAIMKEPVETMASNFIGLKSLLDFSREKNVKRVLFVSSSEVYGKKQNLEPFQENEYGYIDILNPRNSYSIGKRAAETLLASYNNEYSIDFVIARPGHIYGPTASKSDNRASSAFAFAVARGENIVMKSDGSQLRSYCYSLDCASAIIKILLLGESSKAYNISNPDSVITIRQMADILAQSAEVKLIFEEASAEEKKSFNPMSNSSLDSSSLIKLGWEGCFNASKGLEHTFRIIKELL